MFKHCAELWKQLSEEDKPRYTALAIADQGRYNEELLAYLPELVPTEEDIAEFNIPTPFELFVREKVIILRTSAER